MQPQNIDVDAVQRANDRSGFFEGFAEFFTLPFELLDIVLTVGRLLWSVGELVVWVVGSVLELIGAIGDLF